MNELIPKIGKTLMARLERIPTWSLPKRFLLVLGLGFLFTFYDIFDINVSFVQTAVSIIPGCTPETASNYIGLPIMVNLLGYVVGALILSPISDRIGRRNMLLITMLITGLGSLYTALTTDYIQFTISRAITGIGIGADLAVVNVFINEVSPAKSRVKHTSLLAIISACGAALGIWLGLILTTPSTPFPDGLPFGLASNSFNFGWRIMYFLGAFLALVGIFMRFKLPESPRWLISVGRYKEAEEVVNDMESFALKHTSLTEVSATIEDQKITNDTSDPETPKLRNPYYHIFSSKLYIGRSVLLFLVWLFAYTTVYSYSSGMTTWMVGLHYSPAEAGLIVAFGIIGFILCSIFAFFFGDTIERKLWFIFGTVITIIGGIIISEAGTMLLASILGAIVVFFGFNLWIPMAYAWTAESFPTRSRTTGYGLVDGLGHIGAGIAIFFITPMIPHLGIMNAFFFLTSFLVIATIIAQFGVKTKNRSLSDISP